MATTLLLDRTVWDLCLDAKGNIALASEPYSQAQDAASAVKLFAGELWYDTTKGIPYFGQILGRPPPVQFMKAQFVAAALSVPGVVAAVCYLSSITGRQISGQLVLTNRTGAQVNVGF